MGSKKWFMVLAVLLFIIGGAMLLSLLPQGNKDLPQEKEPATQDDAGQLDRLGEPPEDNINDDMPPEETPPLEDSPKKS